MKILLTILFGITLFQTSNKFKNDLNTFKFMQTDSTKHLIYKGQLVELKVDKVIFHSSTNINFSMKFTLKNISNKPIGIDLKDYWKVVHPNQWGVYKKPYREVVDESQIIPDKKIDKAEIFKKFKDKSLTILNPNETIEYYQDWNGSGEKIDLKNKDEYLIISFDGQLLITDGEQVEHLTLNEAEEEKRVVVLNYPIIHKQIPEKALIIKEK